VLIGLASALAASLLLLGGLLGLWERKRVRAAKKPRA